MKWVVTILLEYEWRTGAPKPGTEREIMRTNTEANVASSPTKSEVRKDNQFRIDAVPAGSGLLVGTRQCSMSRAVSVPRELNAHIGEVR